MGIVGHRAGAVHALHETQLLQALAKAEGAELDTAVAMENESGSGSAVVHDAVERGEREIGIFGLA